MQRKNAPQAWYLVNPLKSSVGILRANLYTFLELSFLTKAAFSTSGLHIKPPHLYVACSGFAPCYTQALWFENTVIKVAVETVSSFQLCVLEAKFKLSF